MTNAKATSRRAISLSSLRHAVDASVLIAAAISRAGVCPELLEDLLTHNELVLSEFILDKLVRKLAEKFNFPQAEIATLRQFLEKLSDIVPPVEVAPDSCRDPSDLPVLGTAIAGAARLLITVDKDLLAVGEFQGIAIIKPGAFWHRTLG